MSNREEVYKAIDGEREYQSKVWNENTTTTSGIHSVTEFILYMQDYLTEAQHVVTRNTEPHASDSALHIIRKVTAMGVACMEQNGVMSR